MTSGKVDVKRASSPKAQWRKTGRDFVWQDLEHHSQWAALSPSIDELQTTQAAMTARQ